MTWREFIVRLGEFLAFLFGFTFTSWALLMVVSVVVSFFQGFR